MLALLSIISALSVAGCVIFAISLKKYQKLYYEKQVEAQKFKDDSEKLTTEKDQLVEQHQQQIVKLESELQKQPKPKETSPALEAKNQELAKELAASEKQIQQLEDKIEELNFKTKDIPEPKEDLFDIEEFLHEIEFFKNENHDILEQEIDIKKIQILDPENIETDINLLKLINATNLVEDHDFIATKSPDKEGQDQINSAVIFSGHGVGYLIDGEFSNFLLENSDAIQNDPDSIKNSLIDILRKRVDFLSNSELRDKIQDMINTDYSDEIEIHEIVSCLYLPSESIINSLDKINPEFFAYANKNSVPFLTPAGLMNLMGIAKNTLLAEQNIVKYEILEDIVEHHNNDNDESESPIAEAEAETEIKPEITPKEEPKELKESEESEDDFSDFLANFSENKTAEKASNQTETKTEDTLPDFEMPSIDDALKDKMAEIKKEEPTEPTETNDEDNMSGLEGLDELMSREENSEPKESTQTDFDSGSDHIEGEDNMDIGSFLDGKSEHLAEEETIENTEEKLEPKPAEPKPAEAKIDTTHKPIFAEAPTSSETEGEKKDDKKKETKVDSEDDFDVETFLNG